MARLSKKETEIMLKLFKDFSKNYNANSLSKEINMSPRGALHNLKNLEKRGLLTSLSMGKATFYKINLKDIYAKRTIETLLIEESREKAKKWLFEFREAHKYFKIIILFGSAIRNLNKANDIDVIFVLDKNKYSSAQEFIVNKNRLLVKPIHSVLQTSTDLKQNLEKKNPAIINALKTGYVLHGYENLVKILENVTKF